MERKDRKRRAVEVKMLSEFVSPTITNLVSTIQESDTELKKEISALRDEIGSVKKQLKDKCEECDKFQQEVTFLHPDAVIDRARMKLWHHGDLMLFRDVIDSRAGVNGEGRSLFFCESAPKKAGSKPPISNSKTDELTPKAESEEATIPAPPPSEPILNTSEADTAAEEKEGDYSTVPLPADEEEVKLTPEQEPTIEQEITAFEQKSVPPEKDFDASEQELAETELMYRDG
ncbi:hypothetical protein PR003_g1925 [Phytophthora rubi]|uniref:Uncharacterized protein n=1 Tax=Phytophthora rubi TaxID=129364 RepID=A0A6A3PEL0_9STRA|nr:hypothetical protein PR002_g5175 [Phytophthora rubi]KAE9051100.1 hypothetical protein PR001_g1766 [Phytophthora rubi]KAE9357200.1 hypothetical protein PR003_g1925 [Phytophthora rubi]